MTVTDHLPELLIIMTWAIIVAERLFSPRTIELVFTRMPGESYRRRLRSLLKLKCCFTSTETVGLLGTGTQDVHLDYHTAPEL